MGGGEAAARRRGKGVSRGWGRVKVRDRGWPRVGVSGRACWRKS